MIQLTERATKEIRRIIQEQNMNENTALRVGVKGGGCSGFSYTLGFDDQISEVDQVSEVEGDRIVDAKFKTFGCGSAIASSSLATEWLKGKNVDEAATIKNSMIAEELNLPPVKIHCSVLAEDASKSAIADFKKKQAAKKALAGG